MRSPIPALLFASLSAFLLGARAADWPHLRGPALDGRVEATDMISRLDPALELAWRIPLGSGYSGIAVAGGRAVTMYTDGVSDLVGALDVADGEIAWRFRLGDAHKGHDGSSDGPLSTPVIDDGVVYALDPRGLLAALRLTDGQEVWSKRIDEELGAVAPFFGFTSSPLVYGNLLIVQSGGPEGRMICGLNKESGERRWCAGDDSVSYQSPVLMTLAGRPQLVVVGKSTIRGLVPHTGQLLWKQALEAGTPTRSAVPTFAGEDRFVIQVRGRATAYRVRAATGALRVSEAWRTEALGNSYAAPVYHDGHLYGFRGAVLTCVDAASGERVWRSRPPGGRGLILVGDRLVIYGAEGTVVVAKATPEGYSELARVEALDGTGMTWPAFADNRIFIRNFEEMAALSVVRGLRKRGAATSGGATAFERFVASLETAPDRRARVAEYLAGRETLPIVEGEQVHFVYHGAAEDVAISGSMLDNGASEPMLRAPGTDLFHRTYRLEPDIRWEYRFEVDFEQRLLDERNPRWVPGDRGGDYSELAPAGYETPTHIGEPEVRGLLKRFGFRSGVWGKDRYMQVYRPPGYDPAARAYPLLIVLDGSAWLERGLLTNTLDNLIAEGRIEPLVAVFVEHEASWWLEAGGSRTDDTARMLAEEMIDPLKKQYRLLDDPSSRAILGLGHYGLTAAYAALSYPQIGKAAVQSVNLGNGAGEELEGLIEGSGDPALTFWVDWNLHDDRSADYGRDSREEGIHLHRALQAAGHDVRGGEFRDSRGWGAWRARTDQILESLFGRE